MSMNRGLDVVGADYGGLVSSIFSAAGAGVDYAKQSQKEKEDAAKSDAKLQAAIAADQAATNAVARATVSAAVAKKDPTKAGAAKADALAARSALAAQDKAGADLPEDRRDARIEAAQKAVEDADTGLQNALRAGGSPVVVAQAQLDAANQTLNKAKGLVVKNDPVADKSSAGDGESFFTKKVVGPVKVWHALLGVVGAAGGVYLWRR